MNMLHQIKDLFSEHVYTNALSVAAISSPWWLEKLQDVSQVAALLLPILGGLWLLVQIFSKLSRGK